MILLLLISIGIIAIGVGTLGVLAGFGGGVLLVPILAIFFGYSMKVVIGTVLISLILVSIVGTIGAWRRKEVDLKLGLLFGIPKAVGAVIGAYLTTGLPDYVLSLIIGLMALFLSYNMLIYLMIERGVIITNNNAFYWKAIALTPILMATITAMIIREVTKELVILTLVFVVLMSSWLLITLRKRKEKGLRPTFWKKVTSVKPTIKIFKEEYSYTLSIPVMIVGGIAMGIISGMLGVGGGWAQTPLLVMGFGVPMSISAGTSLFMISMSSITGGIIHLQAGHMDYELLGILVVSLPIGAIIGNYLKGMVKTKDISKIVCLTLGVIAYITILSAMINM
ncbi:MAG: sulfite exporter TauE/SafE family protein [Candidatus Heimdallarchaeota archaeon]|nr:sulfite exporter TauE/SafE family protein [Candidatus Heimdallarchaeota archaeon]MCK5049422.1 sulfite exporter TauE/SafE family protein [Candidatus Heimdallarchaeota archaeon]